MTYIKAKTKLEKIKEQGIAINLVEVSIHSLKKDTKGNPLFKATVEMVYKQIKQDHNKDKYFIARINDLVLPGLKNKEFRISSVKILKNIGHGIYEE